MTAQVGGQRTIRRQNRASSVTVNEKELSGVALCAQGRWSVSERGREREQQTGSEVVPRRRDAEFETEIVAEHPAGLEVLIDPLPQCFEERSEQSGRDRQQRERARLGAESAAVQRAPR